MGEGLSKRLTMTSRRQTPDHDLTFRRRIRYHNVTRALAFPAGERVATTVLPTTVTGSLCILPAGFESDTLLRTENDLIREMMSELGFKRSGKRINDALGKAIKDARR